MAVVAANLLPAADTSVAAAVGAGASAEEPVNGAGAGAPETLGLLDAVTPSMFIVQTGALLGGKGCTVVAAAAGCTLLPANNSAATIARQATCL